MYLELLYTTYLCRLWFCEQCISCPALIMFLKLDGWRWGSKQRGEVQLVSHSGEHRHVQVRKRRWISHVCGS
ncbi:hypothetical protein BDL97_02G137700 [Sphagnum fallax]|nr:hypothetical protein BDL97_02G137700 [Sphagnum fallax]